MSTNKHPKNILYRLTSVRCLLVLVTLFISACQNIAPIVPNHETARAGECRQFLSNLNQATELTGLADAQYTKLPHYPHLRINRFLASLLPDIKTSEQYHFWLDQAGGLALDGFDVELTNLGLVNFQNYIQKDTSSIQDAYLQTRQCIQVLLENEKQALLPGPQILSRATVGDSYKTWQRALGVYPLVILPVAWGINKHHENIKAAHNKKTTQTSKQTSNSKIAVQMIYQPPSAIQLSKQDLGKILSNASNNPLSIPRPSQKEQQLLFHHFAPTWVVSKKGPADLIGTVSWSADASIPAVQTKKATVYTKISYARYHKKILLQLNYIVWFPERPLSSIFDLLGGYLDGITWRVTLDENGEILMQDTMHNCGCYHMFYPGQQVRKKIQAASLAEIAFVPQENLNLEKGGQFKIHVESGTHYITGLSADVMSPAKSQSPVNSRANFTNNSYDFLPYKILRNLPHPSLGYRSMFNDQGLVPGSERSERYLFWPLGIASAGAMRQWGHHATAFIGRRHFDDPDLIEKNFILLTLD